MVLRLREDGGRYTIVGGLLLEVTVGAGGHGLRGVDDQLSAAYIDAVCADMVLGEALSCADDRYRCSVSSCSKGTLSTGKNLPIVLQNIIEIVELGRI
jgi:hypothetical protein